MKTSEHIDKIAPAFLAAQRKFKRARKDGKNPHFNSVFSTLENIFDASMEALHSEGISLLQPPSSADGVVFGVETVLMHESGQWFAEPLMLKPPRPDPQSAGSSITYARRYGGAGMLGIASGDDDDGNAASSVKEPKASIYTGTTDQQVKAQAYLSANHIDKDFWNDIHEALLGKLTSELPEIAEKHRSKK